MKQDEDKKGGKGIKGSLQMQRFMLKRQVKELGS